MAHYDIDTTCKRCGANMSIHPAATDRRRICDQCDKVEKSVHETYGSELANPLAHHSATLDKKSQLRIQVDGNHYKNLVIQPAEYSFKNELNWHQGEIIKYVTRYNLKNERKDLEKARHLIDMLIEFEYED